MNRKKLIERTARLIHQNYSETSWDEVTYTDRVWAEGTARKILALVEEANTRPGCGIDEFGKAFHGTMCDCYGPAHCAVEAVRAMPIEQVREEIKSRRAVAVTPTDDEQEAPEAPVWLDSGEASAWQSGWSSGWDAHRTVQGEKPGEHGGTIPLYGMLDVWMALYGTSHPEFDEFYAEHGYAESWARILDAVRERTVQGEPTCEHEWQHRVSGGSKCTKCDLWQDERVPVQGEPCLTEHPITGWRCSQPAGSAHGHVCDLPPVQVEPSDEAVVAFLNGYYGYTPPITDLGYWSAGNVADVRSGLRAAAATEGGKR